MLFNTAIMYDLLASQVPVLTLLAVVSVGTSPKLVKLSGILIVVAVEPLSKYIIVSLSNVVTAVIVNAVISKIVLALLDW